MTSSAYGVRGARSPCSHDIILIVTSFATELARVMDVCTYGHSLPRLIYKDVAVCTIELTGCD